MLTLEKARQPDADRVDGYTPPVPAQGLGVREFSTTTRRAARVHRLAAVLQRLGDEGPLPRHPQQPGFGEAARKLYDDARDARHLIKEKWLTANG